MSAERRNAVIVSPHLDDAALSASDRLRTGGVVVVTVCAGLPSSSTPVGWWDRLTGATSARGRQEERIAEDTAAMKFARAAAVRLEHLDGQYRSGAPPDVAAVAADVEPLIAVADEVWLPAGVGHDDHLAVREAGMAAARRRKHRAVFLYADVPHAIPYGWPAWVTRDTPPPYLDIDAWLAEQLQASGLDAARLKPRAIRLDDAGRTFKRSLIGHYATQLTAVQLDERQVAANPSLLAYEAAWECEL